MAEMKLALLARVQAKPGKEAEVENFLKSALTIVENEPDTVEWFAIKMGPSTFGIFDLFADEEGRQAHLNGRVAAGLMANAPALLAGAPSIEKCEVLALKKAK